MHSNVTLTHFNEDIIEISILCQCFQFVPMITGYLIIVNNIAVHNCLVIYNSCSKNSGNKSTKGRATHIDLRVSSNINKLSKAEGQNNLSEVEGCINDCHVATNTTLNINITCIIIHDYNIGGIKYGSHRS